MAISVWVINVVFIILGRFLLLPPLQDLWDHTTALFSTGVVHVGDQFQVFWFFPLTRP